MIHRQGNLRSDKSVQYRDPERRAECEDDALQYQGKRLRLGSAASLVNLSEMFFADLAAGGLLAQLEVPFFILAAGEERVVDPSAGERMMAATVRVPHLAQGIMVYH